MSEEPRPACQNTPGEYCTLCGAWIPPTGNFCPRCGAIRASLRASDPVQSPFPMARTVPVRTGPSWRRLFKTGSAYSMITMLAQFILSLVTLIYGITIVLPEIVKHTFSMIIITPNLVEIGRISGDALGVYYLLIVAAILMSAIWLFVTSARSFRKELGMKAESRKHSAIFDLCGLMFAVLFLNMVVILVMGMFGNEATSPVEDTDLWELLFLLANASVWEELIVRVLMIGLPLIAIDLLRRAFSGRALPYKPQKYVLGGGISIGIPEAALLIFSSAMFGMGHYEGWGAWKVFPATVAGLAFGYMFLRHGLAASIMLHFGFDYLSLPSDVFPGASLSILVFLGVALLLWIGMGSVFFGYYLTRMAEFVTKRKYFEDRPAPQPVHYAYSYGGKITQPPRETPPVTGSPELGRREPVTTQNAIPGFGAVFICPVCGSTQARWLDGRFQCLRCGSLL
ncbi:MAG: CPBP family intramembrane metalloprotease [Thermoplasmata archaeon]|nr:CPBP family intramembrane metalloprotease [Thermoplasmata archaeon]